MLKRNLSVLILAILIVSSVLTGCGANGTTANTPKKTEEQAANPEPVKIKIADTLTNPVFRVAATKQFFAKNGIDAEIITFATPAEGVNSLFIKQVDAAYGADFPILNAVSKGDYSIIASTGTGESDESAAQWKLFVRDDIQKPEDLKGKKLSVLRGTFISYLWDTYLADHNLKLDDVKTIGQGGFDESYVALKKGEIDAVWVIGAVLVDKFSALEGVHQLIDMSQTSVRIGGAIVVPDTLIKEHPDAIANFIKAIDEASVFIAANPDEVADILYTEVKQPKESTLKDLAYNNWQIGFTQEAYDSLAKQKAYMVTNGIIKDDFDLVSKISTDAAKQVVPDRVTYNK